MFVCRECGLSVQDLAYHVTQFHPENIRQPPAYCNVCKRNFASQADFNQHCIASKFHKQEAQKRVNAQQNNRGPIGPPNHVAINAQVRCEVCDRAFGTKDGLQMHVENSADHKKEVKRAQKEAEAAEKAVQPTKTFNGIWSIMDVDNSQDTFLDTVHAHEFSEANFLGDLTLQAAEAFLNTVNKETNVQSSSQSKDDDHDRRLQALRKSYESLRDPSGSQSFFFHGGNAWTIVPPHLRDELTEALRKQCHTTKVLRERNWCLAPLTQEELEDSRRCIRCNGVFYRTVRWSVF